MKNKRVLIRFLALTVFLFFAGNSYSRTMYLSPDGNDEVGAAHGAVFKTLAVAVNKIWPGDTLIVKSGTYTGGVYLRRGCTPEKPIVIMADGPDHLIEGSGEGRDGITLADCQWVYLNGLRIRGAQRSGIYLDHGSHLFVRNCTSSDNGRWGIFTNHPSHFVLEGNECSGSGREHGIYHSNSGDYFVIRNNCLHHNAGCGIHINGDPEYGGDGVISYGIVEGNICYANGKPKGGAGINMTHVQDVLVRNNLLYYNYAGGITFYQDTGTFQQGSKRALIMNNTVVCNPGEGRTGVNIMPTSEKALICSNIFVSGGERGAMEISTEYLPSVVSDYNIFWGIDEGRIVERFNEQKMSFAEWKKISGCDSHTKVAAPGFIDPLAENFRLLKTSPAIAAGMPLEKVKETLTELGGYMWVLEQLENSADLDIEGNSRESGSLRTAGAYSASAH